MSWFELLTLMLAGVAAVAALLGAEEWWRRHRERYAAVTVRIAGFGDQVIEERGRAERLLMIRLGITNPASVYRTMTWAEFSSPKEIHMWKVEYLSNGTRRLQSLAWFPIPKETLVPPTEIPPHHGYREVEIFFLVSQTVAEMLRGPSSHLKVWFAHDRKTALAIPDPFGHPARAFAFHQGRRRFWGITSRASTTSILQEEWRHSGESPNP